MRSVPASISATLISAILWCAIVCVFWRGSRLRVCSLLLWVLLWGQAHNARHQHINKPEQTLDIQIKQIQNTPGGSHGPVMTPQPEGCLLLTLPVLASCWAQLLSHSGGRWLNQRLNSFNMVPWHLQEKTDLPILTWGTKIFPLKLRERGMRGDEERKEKIK